MAKNFVKASVISAAVGATVGAAAVALSQKETRGKAIKVLKDGKKQALTSVNELYKTIGSDGDAPKPKAATKKKTAVPANRQAKKAATKK